MTKDLQDKAISIKGKEYVLVSDRVRYFNDTYPKGCIRSELVSSPDAKMVVIKATVIPDVSIPERYFTGYSQAVWGDGNVNKTSALENCETSAWGRALGALGIGVIDSIASADEMNKAGVIQAVKSVTQIKHEFNDSKCEHCGAAIKISMAGKPYCANKCWLPENKHFRDEYQQVNVLEEIPEDLPF